MKLLHQVYRPSSKEDFLVLYPDKSRGFFLPFFSLLKPCWLIETREFKGLSLLLGTQKIYFKISIFHVGFCLE